MKHFLLLAMVLVVGVSDLAGEEVLIVADEIPAMQVLARQLEAGAAVQTSLVKQTNMPSALGRFSAVFVYIHGELKEPVELALIDYTRAGGKLVALHHSISSGKRKNRQWFDFLGIDLPSMDVRQGGYKWIEPTTLEVVNLARSHYITSHQVKYPSRLQFAHPDYKPKRSKPGFVLPDSEVYLNHVLHGSPEVLLGFRFHDPSTGIDYAQATAGWYRPAGQGWIFYFMPGHTAKDFADPAYAQILVNTVRYKPKL
jgi:hypothetical protein